MSVSTRPAPSSIPPGAVVDRPRVALAGSASVVGAAMVAAMLIWRPGPPSNDFSYAAFAPIRDATVVWGVIDGLGFALLALGLAALTNLVTPTRGRGLAMIGASVAVLGGLVFSGTMFGMAAVVWHATSPALSAELGQQMLTELAAGAPPRGLLPVGFLAFTVGLLLLLGALWRGRAVPRIVLAVVAVLTLAQFAGPDGRLLDALQVLIMLGLAAVAIMLTRLIRQINHSSAS